MCLDRIMSVRLKTNDRLYLSILSLKSANDLKFTVGTGFLARKPPHGL